MEGQRNGDELTTIEMIELEDIHGEMLDEQANIRRLEERLAKLMTEAAFQEFPALKNMSAEEFRKFDDRLSRAVCNWAMELSDFAFRAEKETG